MHFVPLRTGAIKHTSSFIEPLEARKLLSTTYYVSSHGNDGNSGENALYPWSTIERVNHTKLEPGDQVLFEGKETFSLAGKTGANLLSNGGFENGFAGWSADGTNASLSTITHASGETHSGSSALKFVGEGDAIRSQDVTSKIESDKAYSFDVRSKRLNKSNGGGLAAAGITFYDDGKVVGKFFQYFAEDWNSKQTWSFVAPRTYDRAKVWITREKDNSQVVVDDIAVREAPTPLVLDITDSGSEKNPVVIGSYGDGRATINAGDSMGIVGQNISNILVQDLNVVGTWDGLKSTGGNFGRGIEFNNLQPGDTKLPGIHVRNLDVTGFKWGGVYIGGFNKKSGFTDVVVERASAYNNGDIGISCGGEYDREVTTFAHSNVSFIECFAYNNGGIIDKGSNSGSGILLGDVDGGLIERSVAHHNGMLNTFEDGGPVGIWSFDSNRVTIQKNESYANATNGGHDGGGFDLDGGVTNSVMQYNYSHDNEGPGYLMYQFYGARRFGANVIRYNISQNDGREQSYGAISLGGGLALAGAIIEHNTIFISPSKTGGDVSAVRLTGIGEGIYFRNNVFQTTGGAKILDVRDNSTSAVFQNNTYWSSGDDFHIAFDGVDYGSLGDWRSATNKEMNGKTKTGLVVDPGLASPGTAPTLNDAQRLESLGQYVLKASSALIDAAIDYPPTWKGYVPAEVDFFGRALPVSGRDIAAAERR